MGPDGRYPGTPGYAIHVAIECYLSYAHALNIGDGIQWSRLQISWRYAEISYAGHYMFLLRNGRLCEVQFNCAPAQTSYKATKRAKDTIDNNQKSVFQNCGMWEREVGLPYLVDGHKASFRKRSKGRGRAGTTL